MTAFLSALFGLLTLLVHVAVIAALVVAVRAGRRGTLPPALAQAVRAHGLGAVALVAGVATLGSLYYSEVAGFVPCDLCWVQRIFAYPIALLATLALVRHVARLRHAPGALPDPRVWRHLVPLAVVGLPVSVYHVVLQRLPTLEGGMCDPTVPCSAIWVQQLGFITIPWMAGSVFAFVLATGLLARLAARSREPQTEDEGVHA